MVQTQPTDTLHGIIALPLFGGAIAAGSEQAVQHGEEDRPLDGKLEAAVPQQGHHHFVDRAGLPESLQDQGRTDPGAASCDALASCVSAENGEFF